MFLHRTRESLCCFSPAGECTGGMLWELQVTGCWETLSLVLCWTRGIHLWEVLLLSCYWWHHSASERSRCLGPIPEDGKYFHCDSNPGKWHMWVCQWTCKTSSASPAGVNLHDDILLAHIDIYCPKVQEETSMRIMRMEWWRAEIVILPEMHWEFIVVQSQEVMWRTALEGERERKKKKKRSKIWGNILFFPLV